VRVRDSHVRIVEGIFIIWFTIPVANIDDKEKEQYHVHAVDYQLKGSRITVVYCT
jgi:hypothetical protein